MFDQVLILGNQATLHLAFRRMAERVEDLAPQEFEFREQAEHWKNPRSQFDLSDLACPRIRPCDSRRRQVKR
jgi:hypothetical protein